MLIYLWFFSIVCSAPVISARKLETLYEWSWIDYSWNSETQKSAAIQAGDYDYTKPVVIDVDVWKGRKRRDRNNRKTFITVARRYGVPASLTTVSRKSGSGGPLLKPYPDWSWTKKGDCNSITSVYRVAIDKCDRLWVMDTGMIEDDRICPAQLLAFDLKTDRLLERIKIQDKISKNPRSGLGLLVTPIVETEGENCEETHVYIADVTGNALLIYNGTSIWRLESPVYSPQEAKANFTIDGKTFYLDDGVLGMALSPKIGENRHLVFRPLASYDIASAGTLNLQESYRGGPVHYNLASGALPSQAVAMAFSSDGTLFFGLTNELAIACWHIARPIGAENIVLLDTDRNAYQFASGVKVVPERITGYTEELWIVTNRYQKVLSESQNFNEINFRVMAARVDELINGTNCDSRYDFPWFFH